MFSPVLKPYNNISDFSAVQALFNLYHHDPWVSLRFLLPVHDLDRRPQVLLWKTYGWVKIFLRFIYCLISIKIWSFPFADHMMIWLPINSAVTSICLLFAPWAYVAIICWFRKVQFVSHHWYYFSLRCFWRVKMFNGDLFIVTPHLFKPTAVMTLSRAHLTLPWSWISRRAIR